MCEVNANTDSGLVDTQGVNDSTDLLNEPKLSELYADPTLLALLKSDNLRLTSLKDTVRMVQLRMHQHHNHS